MNQSLNISGTLDMKIVKCWAQDWVFRPPHGTLICRQLKSQSIVKLS